MSTRTHDRASFETSNEQKVLFPKDITKGELIAYYKQVAAVMLPHIRRRPLTLRRFPDGIAGINFYQKNVPDYYPDWIKRAELPKDDGVMTHVVCDSKATLAYLANQACIELHSWMREAHAPKRPNLLVFDLDPGGSDFEVVRHTAFEFRELLLELGLQPFVKTTGSRGLHVALALKGVKSFDESRDFARAAAELMVRRNPDELTVQHRIAKRQKRLFIDTLRNAYAQTAVAPYSVRAKPGAPVAAPIEWDELKDRRLNSQSFDLRSMPRRIAKRGDPWAELAANARPLKAAAKKLGQMLKGVA